MPKSQTKKKPKSWEETLAEGTREREYSNIAYAKCSGGGYGQSETHTLRRHFSPLRPTQKEARKKARHWRNQGCRETGSGHTPIVRSVISEGAKEKKWATKARKKILRMREVQADNGEVPTDQSRFSVIMGAVDSCAADVGCEDYTRVSRLVKEKKKVEGLRGTTNLPKRSFI